MECTVSRRIQHSICRSLLAAFAFALFLPSAADAACAQWSVPTAFNLVQSNGYAPTFNLRQTGENLTGTATFLTRMSGINLPLRGIVRGSFKGNFLDLTVNWEWANKRSVGIYTGSANNNGLLEGRTYDREAPRSQATWYSDKPVICGPQPQPKSNIPPGGPQTEKEALKRKIREAQRQNDGQKKPDLCAVYAATAVNQNKENISRKCGFTGPRWDSNVANHESWCRVVNAALPKSEDTARTQDLERCRTMAQKIQKPPTIDVLRKSRPGEVILKKR